MLEFERVPEWHTGFYKTIRPLSEGTDAVNPGSKVYIDAAGTQFDAVITVRMNITPSHLSSSPIYLWIDLSRGQSLAITSHHPITSERHQAK
jgi:hypothetical protein